ncbi:hypothetical protein WICMUC_001385 [Wickerhamomyces mucosus]|uniref:Copper-fist domain-containing protein n=1 Tax=Wickerhamomyces mucosus TaxID=1378264 RepID=A0A9P8PU26_9ASCO|nr:hypothetical protein WICMUC_001385 [Wickerhamomyces mucosus]
MIILGDFHFSCEKCVNGHRTHTCIHYEKATPDNLVTDRVVSINKRGRKALRDPEKQKRESPLHQKFLLTKAFIDPRLNELCQNPFFSFSHYQFQCPRFKCQFNLKSKYQVYLDINKSQKVRTDDKMLPILGYQDIDNHLVVTSLEEYNEKRKIRSSSIISAKNFNENDTCESPEEKEKSDSKIDLPVSKINCRTTRNTDLLSQRIALNAIAEITESFEATSSIPEKEEVFNDFPRLSPNSSNLSNTDFDFPLSSSRGLSKVEIESLLIPTHSSIYNIVDKQRDLHCQINSTLIETETCDDPFKVVADKDKYDDIKSESQNFLNKFTLSSATMESLFLSAPDRSDISNPSYVRQLQIPRCNDVSKISLEGSNLLVIPDFESNSSVFGYKDEAFKYHKEAEEPPNCEKSTKLERIDPTLLLMAKADFEEYNSGLNNDLISLSTSHNKISSSIEIALTHTMKVQQMEKLGAHAIPSCDSDITMDSLVASVSEITLNGSCI